MSQESHIATDLCVPNSALVMPEIGTWAGQSPDRSFSNLWPGQPKGLHPPTPVGLELEADVGSAITIYQQPTLWMSMISRLSGTRARTQVIFRLTMQGISGAVTPVRWQKTSTLHATITAIVLIPSCAEGHHHFQGTFLFPVPLKWGLGTCSLIKRKKWQGTGCLLALQRWDLSHFNGSAGWRNWDWTWATCRAWFLLFTLFSLSWDTITTQWGNQHNLQLQRVSMQSGGKVRGCKFCSEKESSEHSFDSSCIFPTKLLFFFKSWTTKHEKRIYSLNLQAYKLLSSDKTKEINVQSESNSISS